jgi:hypothetical protein
MEKTFGVKISKYPCIDCIVKGISCEKISDDIQSIMMDRLCADCGDDTAIEIKHNELFFLICSTCKAVYYFNVRLTRLPGRLI